MRRLQLCQFTYEPVTIEALISDAKLPRTFARVSFVWNDRMSYPWHESGYAEHHCLHLLDGFQNLVAMHRRRHCAACSCASECFGPRPELG